MIKVNFPAAGNKNLTVQVTGILEAMPDGTPAELLFSMQSDELAQLAKTRLRIDSVLFALQEKMGILLWWDKEGKNLILPLESRGAFSFVQPIVADKEWDGNMYWSAFKVDSQKHFFFTLECEPL